MVFSGWSLWGLIRRQFGEYGKDFPREDANQVAKPTRWEGLDDGLL